jgi:hypothetical protein
VWRRHTSRVRFAHVRWHLTAACKWFAGLPSSEHLGNTANRVTAAGMDHADALRYDHPEKARSSYSLPVESPTKHSRRARRLAARADCRGERPVHSLRDPFPGGGERAWEAISGEAMSLLCEVGWKSLGVLEPTALPSIQRDSGVPTLQETDALLVWGGNIPYQNYEMQKSGLADLDNPDPIFEVKSMANIQRWAAGVPSRPMRLTTRPPRGVRWRRRSRLRATLEVVHPSDSKRLTAGTMRTAWAPGAQERTTKSAMIKQ